MIASLVFLAIMLAGCQAFMDIPGVKRVKKDSEYHVLGAQTDHVIVLFTHNGKCDRPGCKDFEDMLTNFYEVRGVSTRKTSIWLITMSWIAKTPSPKTNIELL